jgi:hypothetical protein
MAWDKMEELSIGHTLDVLGIIGCGHLDKKMEILIPLGQLARLQDILR